MLLEMKSPAQKHWVFNTPYQQPLSEWIIHPSQKSEFDTLGSEHGTWTGARFLFHWQKKRIFFHLPVLWKFWAMFAETFQIKEICLRQKFNELLKFDNVIRIHSKQDVIMEDCDMGNPYVCQKRLNHSCWNTILCKYKYQEMFIWFLFKVYFRGLLQCFSKPQQCIYKAE